MEMESPSPQISAPPRPQFQPPIYPQPQSQPPICPQPQSQPPIYQQPRSQPPIYPPPQPHAPVHTPPPSLAPLQTSVPNYSSAPPRSQSHGLSQTYVSPTRPVENTMHKNNLQYYCQKLGKPLPVYQTIKEEDPNPPRFRSTVMVDGRSFASPNMFMQRKAAEQDAARIALEQLPKRIEEKVGSEDLRKLISQDTTFCKMILNEFVIKMNMEKGSYTTVQTEGLLPVFNSSLFLNGIYYNGEAGKTKKEAEQLAARAAILSLLGDLTYATSIYEVVKSKIKLYATLHKIKDLNYTNDGSVTKNEVGKMATVDNQQVATTERSPSGLLASCNKPATVNSLAKTDEHCSYGVLNSVDEAVTTIPSSSPPVAVTPKPSSGAQPSLHEFKLPNSESLGSQQVSLPIVFVPSASEQGSAPDSSSSKRRRKNKRKANKRSRNENKESDRSDIPAVTSNQPLPRCSVAQ